MSQLVQLQAAQAGYSLLKTLVLELELEQAFASPASRVELLLLDSAALSLARILKRDLVKESEPPFLGTCMRMNSSLEITPSLF